MSARSGSSSSVSFRFLAVALAEEALALAEEALALAEEALALAAEALALAEEALASAFALGFAEALPFALGVGALGTGSVSDPESSVIGGKIVIVMAANSWLLLFTAAHRS